MNIMQAMAFVRLGDLEAAALNAEKAARYANAHEQILASASLILAEAGRHDEACKTAARLRQLSPGYKVSQLEKTLYGLPSDLAALFHNNAVPLGLS